MIKKVDTHTILKNKLESLIGKVIFSSKINLRLERILALLEALGNPHQKYLTIHVGGTSGKGSTSTYISNILRADNYSVGLFLSPYLQVINEMFIVNGRMARTSDLIELYDRVEQAFPEVEKIGFGKPSYFEAKFAIACLLFEKYEVDVAVIEVGLGGTLDATNVIKADVSVLVSVGLDHMEILGNTVEEIANDKVGIIKEKGSIICGFSQETTRQIACDKAHQVDANLFLINRDFCYEAVDSHIILKKLSGDILIDKVNHPSFGHNISCAIMACEVFSNLQGKALNESAITAGINSNFILGRFEEIQTSSGTKIILDGAHNADKLKSFFDSIFLLTSTPILIIATKQGRSDQDFFNLIKKSSAKKIIVTSFRSKGIWQSMSITELASLISLSDNDSRVICIEDANAALEYALEYSLEDDIIAITGSFFLVGDLREYWYPAEEILSCIDDSWLNPS